MSEEPQAPSTLSEATAAAAEMIANLPNEATQAPPATPEPTDGGGEDTFPRSYVEELRQEAADYRTRAKNYEQAFSGMTEQEQRTFLNLAQDITQDPAAALETLRKVQENLAQQYEPETGAPAPDQTTNGQAQMLTPEQIEAPTPIQRLTIQPVLDGRDVIAKAETGTGKTLAFGAPMMARIDPVKIEAMVEARFAERDNEAKQRSRVQEVFDEALAINPSYKPGSDSLVQLLHVAQTDPAAGGTLQGAHMVLMGKLEELRQWAIDDYRSSLGERSTRRPVQGGTPTTGSPAEPPKDLAEASKRAREILGATFQ